MEPFVKFPSRYMALGLKAKELSVLLALRYRLGRNQSCWPSITTIAKDSGLDRKTVIVVIERLESMGVIRVSRQPGGHNRYYFFPQTSTENGTAPVPKTGHEQDILTRVEEEQPKGRKNKTRAIGKDSDNEQEFTIND